MIFELEENEVIAVGHYFMTNNTNVWKQLGTQSPIIGNKYIRCITPQYGCISGIVRGMIDRNSGNFIYVYYKVGKWISISSLEINPIKLQFSK